MKTKNLTYVALFAALTIVMGVIPAIQLPFTPVPITLQTLGVMLAGAILGARLGGLSIVVFLAVVAVGFPGLAGGRGGFEVFVGPSAGWILSWPIAAFVIGTLIERLKLTSFVSILAATIFGGMVVIYAIGIPVQSLITEVGLRETFIASSAYIPGDLVKALLASFLAVRLQKANVGPTAYVRHTA